MSESCIKHIEDYWKLKTKHANRLFNNGKYHEALSDYKEALYRAEVLNNDSITCKSSGIPFVQVYVISCNNLASVYQELGNLKAAEDILKQSIYYLLYLAKNNQSYIRNIQPELKKAIITYTDFVNNHSEISETKDILFQILKRELVDKN